MSKPASRSLRGAPGRRCSRPFESGADRARARSGLRLTARALATLATLAATALPGVACGAGAGATRGADATAVAIASIDARLRGSFRLVSFTPDVPLEPMLVSLLEFQYGTLIIRFDGKRIVADSPGVHVDRAYEIREPKGDRFKLVSFDEAGVPYESVCEFSGGDQVMVYSQTAPWTGVATIRRAR